GECSNLSTTDCDDHNVCTDDSCDPETGCIHTNNTLPCDDGNGCTVGDACVEGQCVAGPNPKDCNDDISCTLDECNPSEPNLCVHRSEGCPCNDDAQCQTQSFCTIGLCRVTDHVCENRQV